MCSPRRQAPLAVALALALATAAWAKDELIRTRRKSRPDQPKNPLVDIGEEMDGAARLLKKGSIGELTQKKQETILKKLDDLIDKANKQQQKQNQKNQSQAKQQQKKQEQPKPKPGEKKKQAKKQTKTKKQEKKKSTRPGIGQASRTKGKGAAGTDPEEWGKLPERIRPEVDQIESGDFPAKYRALLRRYYRILYSPED